MGHLRLGRLPRTQKWKEVIGLVDGGGSAAQVADATIDATEAQLSGADPAVVHTVEIADNGGAGVYLASTTGEVVDNLITGNATYGMQCSAATIDDCTGNDLTGNTSGEQTGCDETCGEEAGAL